MNKAVVVISHGQRIREVADRVFWLEDGRLRAEPGVSIGAVRSPSAA